MYFHHGGVEPEWGKKPICKKCAFGVAGECLEVASLPERVDSGDPFALPGLVNVKMIGPRLVGETGCSHFQKRANGY